MVPRTGIWRTKRSASEEALLSPIQIVAKLLGLCSVSVQSGRDGLCAAGHLDAPTKLVKRYISYGNSRN